MDDRLHQEIHEILQHPDVQEDTPLPPLGGNHQATEVIEVYIFRRVEEAEEPLTVEGTREPPLDESETQGAPAVQETTEPVSAALPHTLRRRVLPFVAGVLCILSVMALSVFSLLFMLAPSATVTMMPVAQHLGMTGTYTVAMGASGSQLPGRSLGTVTMSQMQAVPATGTTHQQAQAAQGTITFYNAAPAVQAVPSGTLITGTDGVLVVTDHDAVIPAAAYPVFGQVTVPAHAGITGPAGNIKAADIYGPCCRLNVSAVNSAFHGGQDARTFQSVATQDINGAVTRLKKSLEQAIQAALQGQVQSEETLITPLPCTTHVSADHRPGEEAAQVRVQVDEICTAVVYNRQALHDRVLQAMNQEANAHLGTGYGLLNDIQISIIQAQQEPQGTITLQVKGAGSWAYQFNEQQQEAMKLLITGKSKTQATAALLHVPGVRTVSLTITNGTTIPTDIQRIHLVFVVLTS